MVALYAPKFKLTVNTFDVSATIAPYLISISLEDVFDSDLSVSRLELVFHAKYKRSSSWQYKDQLKLELWWEPFPVFKYTSGIFYVDYIEDVKEDGGTQIFRVSALEADPTLGFTYGVKTIKLVNKTTIQAVTDFKTLFGLTLTHDMTPNVYMGTIPNILGTPTPDINTVTAEFSSYAEMISYICKSFGYFANISGKTLQIYSINSGFSDTTRFFLPSLSDVWNFTAKQSYNKLAKVYAILAINRASSNTITRYTLSPEMSAQLNQKEKQLEYSDGYYNSESGFERQYGEMYKDFYAGFETRISCSALPEMKAGNIFLLDSTYGFHEGYYRCTRIQHKVDAGGWNTEVTGFPLKILQATSASFNVGYVGRYQNPPASKKIDMSQLIRGTTPGLTGTMLDNYAKYYNPNYTLNLGAAFITEGSKTANAIRPDIAFCLALVISENYINNTLVTRKNPSGVLNSAGNDFATFTDFTTGGIRAEIQMLFAYCTSTGSPADAIVAPRYSSVVRGSATKIDDLQGKWNSNLDFSSLLKEKLRQLYIFLNPTFNVTYID